MLGTAPAMLLTFVVVRVPALGMPAHGRAAQRDALLVGFGRRLLGTTDATRIAEPAVASSRALCATTPGLRSPAVQLHATHARVIGVAGAFESVPGHLPTDVVPPGLRPGAVVPVARVDELGAATGEACRWVCLDLPEVDGVPVLLGAPPWAVTSSLCCCAARTPRTRTRWARWTRRKERGQCRAAACARRSQSTSSLVRPRSARVVTAAAPPRASRRAPASTSLLRDVPPAVRSRLPQTRLARRVANDINGVVTM